MPPPPPTCINSYQPPSNPIKCLSLHVTDKKTEILRSKVASEDPWLDSLAPETVVLTQCCVGTTMGYPDHQPKQSWDNT